MKPLTDPSKTLDSLVTAYNHARRCRQEAKEQWVAANALCESAEKLHKHLWYQHKEADRLPDAANGMNQTDLID